MNASPPEEEILFCPNECLGEAAYDGRTSGATIAWTAVGIAFLIAVGIVVAVSLSNHKNH